MDVLAEPFVGSWAVHNGLLTRWELVQGFQRLHRDVYVRKGIRLDERRRALAAALWAKGRGVLTGCSAASLLGAPCPGKPPIELFHPTVTRAPRSIVLRRDRFCPHETTTAHGVTVTTPARTAFDIGRRLPFQDAVESIDALCNTTGTSLAEVAAIAGAHRGVRGLAALRTALKHADPAATSRQETQVRLLLTAAGLPKPSAQFPRTADASGPRVTLGWPEWRVAVEPFTEGATEAPGWQTVWFTADLLASHPHLLVAQVRAALHAGGC